MYIKDVMKFSFFKQKLKYKLIENNIKFTRLSYYVFVSVLD